MALFNNQDDALTFALRFSSQQYAQSALAKLQKQTGRSSDKGLVALDGAAMAGIVKSKIERLSDIERACIVARYSARVELCPCCGNDKTLDEYRGAILTLVPWARQFVSGDNTVQRMLYAVIEEFFVRRRTLGKEAEKLGVPKRTAYDQKDKIWPHLSDLDKRARTLIGNMLGDLCGEDA